MTNSPTQDYIKSYLDYDPGRGLFTWKIDRGRGVKRGDTAGWINANGYREIKIENHSYRACRLAWLYMTGELPPNMVDHKNRKKSDDRWSNLRLATRSQNAVNSAKKRKNKTGYMGVSYNEVTRKWRSSIKVDGVRRHLGLFDSAEEAQASYAAAARKHFHEFLPANHPARAHIGREATDG